MSFLELRDLQKKFVSNELSALKQDEELLLVAYGITNPLSIAQMQVDWETSNSKTKAVGRDGQSTKKIRPIDFGGALTLIKINCDNSSDIKVLAELDIVMSTYPKFG